jgi:hypothetical protein
VEITWVGNVGRLHAKLRFFAMRRRRPAHTAAGSSNRTLPRSVDAAYAEVTLTSRGHVMTAWPVANFPMAMPT